MYKTAIAVTVSILLTPTVSCLAQQTPFIKSLNAAKLERVITKNANLLAPKISGVYIPAGTTYQSLENKISRIATQAGFNLNARDIRIVAHKPQLLRQFQTEVGKPIFEGRTLPFEKGLKVLQENQEKFATSRANREYEDAWIEFISEQGRATPAHGSKSYLTIEDLAEDVYDFYVKYIGVKELPRLRMDDHTDLEGVVCEIPVRGLNIYVYKNRRIDVSPDKIVVVHLDDGSSHLSTRSTVNLGYSVIK